MATTLVNGYQLSTNQSDPQKILLYIVDPDLTNSSSSITIDAVAFNGQPFSHGSHFTDRTTGYIRFQVWYSGIIPFPSLPVIQDGGFDVTYTKSLGLRNMPQQLITLEAALFPQ